MAGKLGQILIQAGLVDEHQLEIALNEQKRTGARLGDALRDLGFVTADAVSKALAQQSGIEHIDLERTELRPEAAKRVPEDLARRVVCVPVDVDAETIMVAMHNPTDIVAIDEIQRHSERFVNVVCASQRQIAQALDRAYGRDGGQVEELIERALKEIGGGEDENAGSVIELVNEILGMSVRREATDIHLQPDKKIVRVRLRIDGELSSVTSFAPPLLSAVVARVKILAELDISETRVPQDGKIRFQFEGRVIDLRVSTFPSVLGESIVIRILDKDRQVFSLDSLGLDPNARSTLQRAARRPNGLILASGPTGSGKTTTLFAALRAVDSVRRKVITLEDPVEYELPLATQCQINEKAGVTFAAGLRAILRHDPDVLLVGEMRDVETANLALKAALTGHLVFSTIHTNDAVRTLSRLTDMGLDPYIVASCLSTVVAQRLVRKSCEHCVAEYDPEFDELAAVGLSKDDKGKYMRGDGCERCAGSGYRGREALFEVLEVTPDLASLISRRAPADEIEQAARDAGLRSFRDIALEKAQAGELTLEEVARVTAEF